VSRLTGSFAPRGVVPGDRMLAPEGEIQPNESEGVKVLTVSVQSANPLSISPHGRWVMSLSSAYLPASRRQAARPDSPGFGLEIYLC
jgi:hypothetical protein